MTFSIHSLRPVLAAFLPAAILFLSSAIARAAPSKPVDPTVSDVETLISLFTDGVDVTAPGSVRAIRFEIELRDRLTGVVATLSSASAQFDPQVVIVPGGVKVELRNVHGTDLDPTVALDVDVTLTASPTQPGHGLLHLAAKVASGSVSIAAVRFPIVDVVAAPSDDLAWPFGTGALLEDALSHPLVLSPEFDDDTLHPGKASMQWMCLQPDAGDTRPSFYLATQDGAGVYKEYRADAVADAIRLSVRHVPADPHRSRAYAAPFATTLGYVDGDWYDAARVYRAWAETQPWTTQGPMRVDDGFSTAARNMAMFGTFGPDPDFKEWWPWPERHQEQVAYFGTANIVPQVYGWYPHLHDTEWGNWSADPDFTAAAGPVAAMGGAFSPYTLIHAITLGNEPQVPGYESSQLLGDFALIDEDGEASMFDDVSGNASFEICQSTKFAGDYAVWLATRLKGMGAGGVYLDVLNTMPPQLCFATHHGHVPADPMNTARRLELVSEIKEAVGDGSFYVSSESVNEMYLGRQDIGMSQWTRNVLGTAVTHVPLFETVYHDFLRIGQLGLALNMENEDLLPEMFFVLGRQTLAAHVALGRAPFTGALLNEDSMLDNAATSPVVDSLLQMVRDTVALLELPIVREHVALGEKLRDPEMDTASIEMAPLGALLGGLTIPGGTEQPLVYASTFGRPDEGSILVLLQNWTDGDDAALTGLPIEGGAQPYAVTVDPAALGYAAQRYDVLRVRSDGTTEAVGVIDASNPVALTGVLAARSCEAFLLVPSTGVAN